MKKNELSSRAHRTHPHRYKHFRAVYEHFSIVAAQCAEMYDA